MKMPKNTDEIFDGVIGGGKISSDRIRRDINPKAKFVMKTETDRRLTRLLILHPQFEERLPEKNLVEVSEETKTSLIAEIYRTLDIVPLAGDVCCTSK